MSELVRMTERVAYTNYDKIIKRWDVAVKIRYPDLQTTTKQTTTIPYTFYDDEPLIPQTRELFESAVPKGQPVRLLG